MKTSILAFALNLKNDHRFLRLTKLNLKYRQRFQASFAWFKAFTCIRFFLNINMLILSLNGAESHGDLHYM